MSETKLRSLIIGNLHSHPSADAFLQKFIRIIKELNEYSYVISGDKPPIFKNIFWININYGRNSNDNSIKRYMRFIINQLKLLGLLLTRKLDYDYAIILPTSFILPAILLKLKRKKVVIFVAQELKSTMMNLFIRLNFWISDMLIVESEHVITEWNIDKYKKKIHIGGLYTDEDFFCEQINLNDRKNLIGFAGRLSEDKGIMNFIESIPKILEKNDNIKFLIAGQGELDETIKTYLTKNDLNNKVELCGWVKHDELPNFLNKLKLFVLPSKTEGLPNIVLEAMASGTPVLATPVGGIPDLIKDNYNGFILEDNSANCIETSLLKSIECKYLNEIGKRAHNTIEKNYTYKIALNRWKDIIMVFYES